MLIQIVKMNFVNSFTKNIGENYNIVDCSSQCEIDQEEIVDTSSPECLEKKYIVTSQKNSSFSKKKLSVKRNILNQMPVLDIRLSKRNFTPVRNKGSCHGTKRKRLSTEDIKILNNNDFLSTFTSLKKNLHNYNSSVDNLFSRQDGNVVGDRVFSLNKLDECSGNLCSSAVATELNKCPSPDIFSDDGSCHGTKTKRLSTEDIKILNNNDFLSTFPSLKKNLHNYNSSVDNLFSRQDGNVVGDRVFSLNKLDECSGNLCSSVVATELNKCPSPDIFSDKGSCHGTKTKRLSTEDIKILNNNDFLSTFPSLKKNLHNYNSSVDNLFSRQDGNVVGDRVFSLNKLDECSGNLCSSAVATELNKCPSPDIFSDDGSCHGTKTKRLSTEDIKILNNNDFLSTFPSLKKNLHNYNSSVDNLFSRQDGNVVGDRVFSLNKLDECSGNLCSSVVATELNKCPSPDIFSDKGSCHGTKTKRLSTEDIKILNNNDFLSTFPSLKKNLHNYNSSVDNLFSRQDGNVVGDRVFSLYKLDECSGNLCSSAVATELNKCPSPDIFSDEDCAHNHSAHKEEISCSQDSCFNITSKDMKSSNIIEELNESSSPEKLLFDEDSKVHTDSYDSQENIIYSDDSELNELDVGLKINVNKVEELAECSGSSQLFNEEEIVEEEIGLRDTEIEDCSQKSSVLLEDDMEVSYVSSTNSVKIEILTEKPDNEGSSCVESEHKNCTFISSHHNRNYLIGTMETTNCKSDRAIKAPKNGSLLQRAFRVISDLKKEANLFAHEIKVGLRTSRGPFVSEPLLVENIYYEEGNYILSCKAQFMSGINFQLHLNKNIHLVLSKLPADIGVSTVIVVHFPLVVLLGLPSMSIILFAENRVQVMSLSNHTRQACLLDNSLLFRLTIGLTDQKVVRVIKKKDSKNLFDAVVNQLFVNQCSLELRLLHLFKRKTVNSMATELLAVDSEKQFCLIKVILEDLHVEVNNLYKFLGFRLKECLRVKDEIKSAAEYYSSLEYGNDFIYILEPCIKSWEINFVAKITPNPSECSSLNSVIDKNMNHKRFKQIVQECKVFEDKVFIRYESQCHMTELHFDELCIECKMKCIKLSVPFILNGIYYLKGCLFYDKYCQLILV